MAHLVILPGLNGTAHLLEEFVEARPAGIDAQIISYPTEGPQSYERLAIFAAEKLPLNEDCFLLAESFSGPIAIEIASRMPSGLQGIIFAASFAAAPIRAPSQFSFLARAAPILVNLSPAVIEWLTIGANPPPWFRQAFKSAIAEVPGETLAARLKEALKTNRLQEFSKLDLPMLYLRASNDRLVPARASNKMAKSNQKLSIADVEGPHFLLQAAPDKAWAAIASFCDAAKP